MAGSALFRDGPSARDLAGVQENKEIVRRFYTEVWINGNFDVANEVFADYSSGMICGQPELCPLERVTLRSPLTSAAHSQI